MPQAATPAVRTWMDALCSALCCLTDWLFDGRSS